MKIHLLVIDPQVDFCDPKKGALYVNGADQDMARLATMVRRVKTKLDDVHCTLDSHHFVHVAHPVYWKDSSGKHPAPFTIITEKDVENGTWTTTQPGFFKRGLEYVRTLARNGRYPLCIWPPHCLIGSEGYAVVPDLRAALLEWEQEFAQIDWVTKGSNPHTEHYSAVVADVVDPSDPKTQLNTDFVNTLIEADMIAVAGEAGSHCLLNTMQDICKFFNDPSFVKKLVLLTDATSPVPGFEKLQEDFIKDMTSKGMQTSTTVDFLS